MIKVVLWDLDGTLIDSESMHYQAILAANKRIGLNLDESFELAPGLEGVSVFSALCEQAGFTRTERYSEWYQYTIDYALQNLSDSPHLGLNIEWVEAFSERGIRQCVVSNSDAQIVSQAIQELKIDAYIEQFFSRDMVQHGKPNPAIYLHALDVLGISPDQVVAIEDSCSGVTAAKAAGLFTLAYNNELASADLYLNDVQVQRQHVFDSILS